MSRYLQAILREYTFFCLFLRDFQRFVAAITGGNK